MAKSIMIQGTMSNAGKSILVTALCRIFTQDGYNVAPFKSQNMALNSYITKDGYEMGRAQVAQAEAAKKEPSYLMNPILLKPTTDVGSQVIVNGKVVANMTAREYFKMKKSLIPNVMEAYNKLSSENDIIVIEGAGSPAEINLKQNDIVNMGLAKLTDSPVLLVGDIDRGGVFAQLYGTVELLEEEEKERIKGLIINKFRGDVEILKPGLKTIEDLTNIPCIGVVPYLNVDIDDEDSLSEKLTNSNIVKAIDIAVIKLPRISNFTDFNSLSIYPNVSVRYVTSPKELKNPDMIIIPGTKSTISDLLWMRQNGLEASIKKLHSNGTIVFGICGGYQMLGEKVFDPNHVENSNIDELQGMGLINMTTTFTSDKTTKQVEGILSNIEGIFSNLNNLKYTGYEIHMGKSQGDINQVITSHNNVYGTYVHGIFDEEKIVKEIINSISKKKNLSIDEISNFNYQQYKEEQYDKLADIVRKSLDMDKIYKILGL